MDALPELERHKSAIRNAAWHVRYARRPVMRAERARAIAHMGRVCRAAFNASDDFEPLLIAIVEGLSPRDDPPPF